MDKHPTLDMLLSSLFASNILSNWSIYDDKNGCVNVRLRFTKCDDIKTEHVSFRRKSQNQLNRDRERAIHHKTDKNTQSTRILRSHMSDVNEDEPLELPRSSEENCASDMAHVYSPVSVQMDPEAEIYVPCSSPVNHDESADFPSTPEHLAPENSAAYHTSDVESIDTTDDLEQFNQESDVSASDTVKVSESNKPRKYCKKEYVVHMKKIKSQFKEVRCHRCYTSDTVAKHVELIKMFYCSTCRVYICEKCYPKRSEKHAKHREKLKEI